MKLSVSILIAAACGSSAKPTTEPTAPFTPEPTKPEPAPDTGGFRMVAPSALEYTALDPKGGKGPELAAVSGGNGGGGSFFLRLPPGSKPGLHTHSADYHAILVSGTHKHWLPGGDKKAKALAPGSYWFQPGKAPHGDECVGPEPCVLFLVLSGAYDFTATPNAKPGKADSYLLVARDDVKFAPADPSKPDGVKLGIVSGDPKTGPVAFIVEIPAGGTAGLHSHTSEYHAIVVGGAPAHWLPHEKNEGEAQAVGTYWFQPGGYVHGDRCTGATPCHAFVMMPKPLDVKPVTKN